VKLLAVRFHATLIIPCEDRFAVMVSCSSSAGLLVLTVVVVVFAPAVKLTVTVSP
jgi:hypothetical protein